MLFKTEVLQVRPEQEDAERTQQGYDSTHRWMSQCSARTAVGRQRYVEARTTTTTTRRQVKVRYRSL